MSIGAQVFFRECHRLPVKYFYYFLFCDFYGNCNVIVINTYMNNIYLLDLKFYLFDGDIYNEIMSYMNNIYFIRP